MLSEAGRAREAIALLQPFASGNDPDVLNAYGVALADGGDHAGAITQFDRILARDPNNARAHQNRGIVALRSEKVGLARQELERALTLDPKLPQALNALGVVEAKSGNMSAAIDRWSIAVALDPAQFDALFNLGVVAAQEGRRDIARKALSDYVARAPAKFAAERKEAAEMLRTLR
jgi:Flp pilus assembly protein TadD